MDLNAIMEFDHVIQIIEDEGLMEIDGVWAPDVHSYEDDNGQRRVTVDSGWTLMTGYSGQYGYSGPVMHPSEFIGGAMARDILAEPGIYVAVVVSDLDDEENDDGWAVARKLDS